MIQDIITYIIVGLATVIAGAYIYKMFCSKKNNGCAGCSESGCLLKDNIKEKQAKESGLDSKNTD